MKNIKTLKKLFIVLMIIGVVLTFSNYVCAADDDPFLEITPTNTATNETTNNTNNTTTNETSNTNNSIFTNTENTSTNSSNSTLTTNSISNNTNTSNNTVNRSVSNTDTLAKTGLSDSKGTVTLIVVLCGISAIYSYKKINDYKKL